MELGFCENTNKTQKKEKFLSFVSYYYEHQG
jgi:hypothetical protein